MDPLPTMEKNFNIVGQEENHKSVMLSREQRPKNMATFVVSPLARPHSMQGEKVLCKHCKKVEHEESNCFELICYPATAG